jgi:hypothetical protein
LEHRSASRFERVQGKTRRIDRHTWLEQATGIECVLLQQYCKR